MNSRVHPEIILSILLFGILLFLNFTIETTGNTGDSVVHYLFSHYSFDYPEFFFDHWAKPVFVFLSAPFAQFGFTGIVVFNCLCATLTALFTFYTARNLKLNNPYLVYLFIFFSPLYFNLIFSGLTEYLFALFLIIGVYLMSRSKYIPALIVISFLPLVRSEGLLILGVFGIYLLLNKKYKMIPFLLSGQLLYTIIGAIFYKDPLWVINDIPYANLGSPYGQGELFDFVHRLNYVIEKPIYLLLIVGSVSLTIAFIRSKLKNIDTIQIMLILGTFVVFFVAHSIFWWQGIFNSMGLARVLIAVVPIIALLALYGVQTISDNISSKMTRNVVISLYALLIIIYPFTHRDEGIVFNREMFIVQEHSLIDEELVPYIEKEFPDYATRQMYFSNPYICLPLDIDYFDPTQKREIKFVKTDELSDNALIIWDDWNRGTDDLISLDDLKNNKNLILLEVFERQEKDRLIQFAVFKTFKEG